MRIAWDELKDDFSLFVYKGRLEPDGNADPCSVSTASTCLIAQSNDSLTVDEHVVVPDADSGVYTVRVVYRVVTESDYRGSASFLSSEVEPCTGTPDHVWFLGVVYDKAKADDFQKDVRYFESFLATLRGTYCIPASQSKILAMEDDYQDPVTGKTYPEASEANLKAELTRMGEESTKYADSKFFFFLSSHGLTGSGTLPINALNMPGCPPTRVVGSYAGLKGGGGEDGFLDDCELGDELNTSFSGKTRMLIVVDCSFCGGFSDSLTAVSGSVPDGSLPTSSGVPAPNRVVVTGCAITTECLSTGFGEGGYLYRNMQKVLDGTVVCDGWTAPGFPDVQGFDAPVRGAPFNPLDGRCTASEWFFATVRSVFVERDVPAIQQQFRIKYGFESLTEDLVISAPPDPTQVSFTSDSPSSGQYSDSVTLSALLEDEQGAVEGARLRFEIADDDEQRSFSAITGSDGRASVDTALSEAPGLYELTVRFDGGAGRGASSDSRAFTVDPEDSDLALSVSGRGPRSEFVAHLTDMDSGYGIAERTVDFFIDDDFIGAGRTDVDGRARLAFPAEYRRGRHTFEARFAGDAYYHSSSATAPRP